MDNRTVLNCEVKGGKPITRDSGGGRNTIFSISVDGRDRIWTSGVDSIARVNPDRTVQRFHVSEPFSYFLPSPGDGRNFVVGLRDGLLEVKADGTVAPFGVDGTGFQNVSALIMARDGTFWNHPL